jgi:hypothetical protein
MSSLLATNRNHVLLWVSIALFLAACALPALVLHNRHYLDNTHYVWGSYQSIRGGVLLIQGLALGWIRLNFTAFANLPLWLSWIQYWRGRYEAARLCSSLALIISIETLQLTVQPYLYDEGATTKGFLIAPHIGFFCWIAGIAVIFFGSNNLLKRQHAARRSEPRAMNVV